MKAQKNHTRGKTSFICKRFEVYQKESQEKVNMFCVLSKISSHDVAEELFYLYFTLKSTDTYNILFTKCLRCHARVNKRWKIYYISNIHSI